jgi:hypothetical protein
MRRLLAVAALAALFAAAAVLAAPVHADAQGLAPGLSLRAEPDPPAEPDVDDADEEVVDWTSPSDDGDSPAPAGGEDPTGSDERDGGEPLGNALDESTPDWDALEQIQDQLPAATSTIVPGGDARPRRDGGRAVIPRGAPRRVRRLVWHLNSIVGKRGRRGGAQVKLAHRGDRGAAVLSYGLIKSGLLRSPMTCGRFAHWGEAGAGRWVTIYANNGHVYIEVAGLRLDTSSVGDHSHRKGLRWRPVIGKRDGFKVRHPAGL